MEKLSLIHSYISKHYLPQGFTLQPIELNKNCCVIFVDSEKVFGELMIGVSRNTRQEEGLCAQAFLDLKSGKNEIPFGVHTLVKEPTDLPAFYQRVLSRIDSLSKNEQ
jgi:hypothetical protein